MRTHNREFTTPALPAPLAPTWVAETNDAWERWLDDWVTRRAATRVLAYQLWERAGRPCGDGVSFWLEAERVLLDQS